MMVALVNLRYPYGARQIYLNHSLISVASRLAELDQRMKLIDFNIDEYAPVLFKDCEKVGVSLLGAPYIPEAKKFVQRLQTDFPRQEVAIGGQVVEHISREGFAKIFHGLPVKQIVDDDDFRDWAGESVQDIPNPLQVSCIQAWRQLKPERLRVYMQNELTLEVSQGCIYRCKFCAARKRQREQLKNLCVFEGDLRFLVERAKSLGLKKLKFYASALDFFQNPSKKIEVLRILGMVRKETGIDIQVRCLTCMSTFLSASQKIEKFPVLIHESGIYCVGFGVDGNEESWGREQKKHNKAPQVQQCVELCRQLGIRAELLMVTGFPRDSFAGLWKNSKTCIRWGLKSGVVLRLYLAKDPVPGNDYWPEWEKIFAEEPEKFMALDYLALQSKIIDPSFFHRWACNLTYLTIVGFFYPFGRCSSIPLLPPEYGGVARLVNRLMPADR